jgi:hypothetical protein
MGKKSKKAKATNGKSKQAQLSFKDPLTGEAVRQDEIVPGFWGTREYRSYASGQYEIEFDRNTIILTSRLDNWKGDNTPRPERFDVSRVVIRGQFSADKQGLLTGSIDSLTSFNLQSDTERDYPYESAQSYKTSKGTRISSDLTFNPSNLSKATYFYSNLDANTYDSNGQVVGNSFDSAGRFPGTPLYSDRNSLRGLPDASFFPEGWWQNPFAPNLI